MRAHIEVAEARTALASVSFGFVLVRVRVRTAWGPLALLILMCIVKSLRGGLK